DVMDGRPYSLVARGAIAKVPTVVRATAVAAVAMPIAGPGQRERALGARKAGEIEKRSELGEGGGDDRVVGPAAALLAGEEARVDELLGVVADGGLTDAELFGEVAGAHGLAALAGDVGQQSQACGIRQR